MNILRRWQLVVNKIHRYRKKNWKSTLNIVRTHEFFTFTFPLAVGAYGSLQLSIKPWVCAHEVYRQPGDCVWSL